MPLSFDISGGNAEAWSGMCDIDGVIFPFLQEFTVSIPTSFWYKHGFKTGC